MRLVISCLLFLTASSGCSQDSPTGGSVGESALTRQVEVDFGTLRPSAQVKRTVTLFNPSTTSVTITGFAAGCGCTVAKINKPVIPATSSAEVEVSFSAGVETADYERYIVAKEKNGLFATIKVLARVRHDLQVLPARVVKTIGVKSKERVAKPVISVFNHTPVDWSDIEVSSEDPWLTVDTPYPIDVSETEDSTARQVWRTRVDLTKAIDLPHGSHKGALLVTNLPDKKFEMRVPVLVSIRPLHVVTPEQVVFTKSQIGKTKTIAISGISAELGVSARILPATGGKLVELTGSRRSGSRLFFDLSRTELPNDGTEVVKVELVSTKAGECLGRVEILIL